MTLIALTGGIGSGKTTLARQFKELGADMADADDIAHSVYLPGNKAYDCIVARWGISILDSDKTVNRKSVAEIVFKDDDELKWLNGVVHPFVRGRIAELSEHTLLFCAIPLLDESGWRDECAAVVASWCPPDVQRKRLHGRGWDDAEIRRRLEKQVSMDAKLRNADYGVITNCSWDCLRKQCEIIYREILRRFKNND